MDEKKRQEIALKRFALISPAVNGFEQNEPLISVRSANSRLTCPTMGSVSYTHLDVYKRQKGAKPVACRNRRPLPI